MKTITAKSIWLTVPVLALALLMSGSCGGGPDEGGGTDAGASIILIAVDGLRADLLGCYGGEASTPFLDELAGEAVVFDQAWAQSPGGPSSLASLLTGLYPTTHGLVDSGDRLVEEAPTLGETLQQAGLATAAFLEGADGNDDLGLAQGFATFNVGDSPAAAGLEWLDAKGKGDFFLLLGGWSAEQAAAGNDDEESLRSALLRHHEHVDKVLEAFSGQLEARGLADTVTLVVTATSGVALEEHGAASNDGLYPETTRVPMLIRRSGNPNPSVVSKTVELIDLMPTLVEMAGADLPGGVQGSSLLPIMAGSGTPPYVAFSETDSGGGRRSVIMDGMLLLASETGNQLYDLASDPLALTDVGDQFPDRLEVLQSHLEAWGKMVAAASLDPDRRTEDLDDETLDQLRSLGYIQ